MTNVTFFQTWYPLLDQQGVHSNCYAVFLFFLVKRSNNDFWQSWNKSCVSSSFLALHDVDQKLSSWNIKLVEGLLRGCCLHSLNLANFNQAFWRGSTTFPLRSKVYFHHHLKAVLFNVIISRLRMPQTDLTEGLIKLKTQLRLLQHCSAGSLFHRRTSMRHSWKD